MWLGPRVGLDPQSIGLDPQCEPIPTCWHLKSFGDPAQTKPLRTQQEPRGTQSEPQHKQVDMVALL